MCYFVNLLWDNFYIVTEFSTHTLSQIRLRYICCTCQTFGPIISASFSFHKPPLNALTVAEMYTESSCRDTLLPLNASWREHWAEGTRHQWLGREGTCGGRLREKTVRKEDDEEIFFFSVFGIIKGSITHTADRQQRRKRSGENRRVGFHTFVHSCSALQSSSPEATGNARGAACCHWQPRLPW